MKTISRQSYLLAKAFTLIEIMLVVAIISVLLGLAINKMVGSLGSAKIVKAGADIATISSQITTYEMNALRKPTTNQGLEALVNKPTTGQKSKRWVQLMKSVPLDPWQNPYQYRIPGKHNPTDYDLFSWGPDGQEGTEDDIGNWE